MEMFLQSLFDTIIKITPLAESLKSVSSSQSSSKLSLDYGSLKTDRNFFECSFKKPLKISDTDTPFLVEFLPADLNAYTPYGCVVKADSQNNFVDCDHIKTKKIDKSNTLLVAYPVERIQETIKENKFKLSRTATTITLFDGKTVQNIYNIKNFELANGILSAYTNHSNIFDCGALTKCNLDSGTTTSRCITKNKEAKLPQNYDDKMVAFFESVKAKYFSAAKSLLSDDLKQNMQNEHLEKFFEPYGKIEQNIFSNARYQYILYPNCKSEKLVILEIKIIDDRIDNFFILD